MELQVKIAAMEQVWSPVFNMVAQNNQENKAKKKPWLPTVSLNASLLAQWWCDATKIPDTVSLLNSLKWKNCVSCKGQSLTQAKTTFKNYKTARAEWGLNTHLPTDGLMALSRWSLPSCLAGLFFIESTLINILGLPTRLNLSSAVNCPVWTDQPQSLHDETCQPKHKDNPVIPAYTADSKKHLWQPFSEMLALAFWSN